MKTLPDYLGPGLELLSIGLNPSINSVRAGYYFATPQNRFWRALNGSHLLPAAAELEPGVAAIEQLFRQFRIGFTDVVKRPSRSGSALRAADYRRWVPVLREHIDRYRPAIAWFHGKVGYRQFLKVSGADNDDIPWGQQQQTVLPVTVFVTPNPSPANAAYSLADLIDWYNRLASLRNKLVT